MKVFIRNNILKYKHKPTKDFPQSRKRGKDIYTSGLHYSGSEVMFNVRGLL